MLLLTTVGCFIYLLIVNTTTITDSILQVHSLKHWKQLNLKYSGVGGSSRKLQLRVHITLKSGPGFTLQPKSATEIGWRSVQ